MNSLELILSALENGEDWWTPFDSKTEAKIALREVKYLRVNEETILFLATLAEFDSSESYNLSEIYQQCLEYLKSQLEI